MDPVQKLVAESAIRACLAAYCRGVDRRDMDLVRSAFHDDAWDDHGNAYQGGPDGFVEFVRERMSAYLSTMHALHQSLFEFESDTSAQVETYCLALHRFGEPSGRLMARNLGVRYIDRFENRHGSWRITRRTVVVDSDETYPVHGCEGRVGASRGRHDRDESL